MRMQMQMLKVRVTKAVLMKSSGQIVVRLCVPHDSAQCMWTPSSDYAAAIAYACSSLCVQSLKSPVSSSKVKF